MLRKAKEIYLLQVHVVDVIPKWIVEEENAELVPLDLTQVLLRHKEVFEEPTSLPPARSCDHRIPLI